MEEVEKDFIPLEGKFSVMYCRSRTLEGYFIVLLLHDEY